jgi:hypothetical protein
VVVGMGVGFHGCFLWLFRACGALRFLENLAVLYSVDNGETSKCRGHLPAGACCFFPR